MSAPVDRRRLLQRGMLVAGATAPLAILAEAQPAAATESRNPFDRAKPIDAGPPAATLLDSPITPTATRTGVQFTGTLGAGQLWVVQVPIWPAGWHVIWHAISTTPRAGVLQIQTDFGIERASFDYITYWIAIHNMSNGTVGIEGRFAVLNQG